MEKPQCRYCYESNGKLISICDCKGSVKWVHGECAKSWILTKQDTKCPVCKSEQQCKINNYAFSWEDWNEVVRQFVITRLIMFTYVIYSGIAFMYFSREKPISFYMSCFKNYYLFLMLEFLYTNYLFLLRLSTPYEIIFIYLLCILSGILYYTISDEMKELCGYYIYIIANIFMFLFNSYTHIKRLIMWNDITFLPLGCISS